MSVLKDPKKFRFRSSVLTGKLVLQIKKTYGPYSGPEVSDAPVLVDKWVDAKIQDVNTEVK